MEDTNINTQFNKSVLLKLGKKILEFEKQNLKNSFRTSLDFLNFNESGSSDVNKQNSLECA